MKKYDLLKTQLDETVTGAKTDIAHLHTMADEAERISKTARDVHIIITDIDRQFEEKTKLTKIDMAFLFLAVALQVARQYFFTNFKARLDHLKAAELAKKQENTIFDTIKDVTNNNERVISTHNWYHPSLNEIIYNPVPFDITRGIAGLGGGFEHRAKTLGHDPILGYIFGTANIATSTLTTSSLQSFHVQYVAQYPAATNYANTFKVFSHTIDRLFNEGTEGKIIVAASVFREAMHLKSDINSKVSLPIPLVSPLVSPEFAKEIARYGFDMANSKTIGKQATYAVLINTVIAMVHRLLYDESKSGNILLYEVRTRKILTYSNVIASLSNLIIVAIAAAAGIAANNAILVKQALSYLDIGGLVVTLYRIVTDLQFIKKVKQEFLEKEFYDQVYGKEYDF